MVRRHRGHLYKYGAKAAREKSFEHRYGAKKGKYVYGAVVGKVYRETHGGKSWNKGKRYRKRGYRRTGRRARRR